MKKINLFYFFVLLSFGASAPLVKAAEAIPLDFNELILTIDDQKETLSRDQIENFFLIEPTLKMSPGKKSEIENIQYCPTSPILCQLLPVFGQKKILLPV